MASIAMFSARGELRRASSKEYSKPLTRISDIRELSSLKAASSMPVKLRGMVTAFSGYKQSFFFLDKTASISVDRNDSTEVAVGDEIELTGNTGSGMFAPVVVSSQLTVIRHGHLPKAPLYTYRDLAGGSEDSQWVQVQGIVHTARPIERWGHKATLLSVELGGGSMNVYLQNLAGTDYTHLIDAEVRLRGVCASDFNEKRQFVNLTMFVPQAEDLEIIRASPADPFSGNATPVSSVLQFSQNLRFGHRVLIRGTVTYQSPGHSIYVQDSGDGIRVETSSTNKIKIGQSVEVIGFPAKGDYSPILTDGQIRTLEQVGPIVPTFIDASDVITQAGGFYKVPDDQQLVQVRGDVVETHIQGDLQIWLLQQNGHTFQASLPRSVLGTRTWEAKPGSTVLVTGVCAVYSNSDRAPSSFTVLMRSDRDLKIERGAPWLTLNHALVVLAAAGSIVGVVLLWAASLKRKVFHHTRTLRKYQGFLHRACGLAEIGCWELDLKTGELSRSPESYRILGAPADYRPNAEQALEVFPREYRKSIKEAMDRASAGGEGWDLEVPLTTVDGRNIWARVIGAAELQKGKPVRLIGAFQDITAQVEARNVLRTNQEFLDRTGQLAGVGGWEIDLDSGAITWSDETYHIHGLPLDYKPTLDGALAFYTPESRPVITAAVDLSIKDGKGWDLELSLTRADGRMIWVRTVGTAQFCGGRPSRLSGAFQDVTLQVAEREELRRANERIALATDVGGIGIWDWDITQNVLTCDDRMYQIHGRDRNEPESDGLWRDNVHPDDKAMVLQALSDAVNGVKPYDLECRILWKDGSIRYLRGTARVTRDSTGRPFHMIGVNWDVTDQRRMESDSTLQHERLSLATDCSGIGIWELNLVTNELTWDNWMYRLYGVQQADNPSTYTLWKQCVHPADVAPTESALLAATEGTVPLDTEFRVIWPDRTIRNIRATGRVTRDHTGRALRLVGANWDITDSRRLTEELAKQHELLQVTLQSIGDGVITTDAQANVTWLNSVAELMTGWSATEAVGQPIGNVCRIVNEVTRSEVESPVKASLRTGETVYLAEGTVLVSRSGIEFGIEDSAAPIFNSQGEKVGVVLVFHDVTEQRRLAAERAHVNKLAMEVKDDFLSHVSHELRSPLSSIYSFTSIVADGLAGDITPEQLGYLQIVLKNSDQLKSMIEDLLTVTREKEGKLSILLEELSVSDAVNDAVNTVSPSALNRLIALSTDDGGDIPLALADPIRLRQILIILLDNAIKFTPPGGRVNVRVSEARSGFLLIQVTDTGRGIPADMTDKIFEHMVQLDDRPGIDGRKGLGIGLHIAKDLVLRQGGEIWVKSSPGRGSVFSFTVPTPGSNATLQSAYQDGALQA